MAQTLRIDKVWGYEKVLVNEPEYCAKILHVLPGKKCSLHYHRVKKETFVVESGLVRLEHGCQDELLKSGEARTINPGTPHRFSSDRGASILEVSTHHKDSDVTRLEPSGDVENAPRCFPIKFNPELKANARVMHIPATNPRDERGAQSGPDVPHSS